MNNPTRQRSHRGATGAGSVSRQAGTGRSHRMSPNDIIGGVYDEVPVVIADQSLRCQKSCIDRDIDETLQDSADRPQHLDQINWPGKIAESEMGRYLALSQIAVSTPDLPHLQLLQDDLCRQ